MPFYIFRTFCGSFKAKINDRSCAVKYAKRTLQAFLRIYLKIVIVSEKNR